MQTRPLRRAATRAVACPMTLLVPVLALAPSAPAATVNATIDTPALDRWMYPFNPTPGNRITISTFGAFTPPDFDNRDGQCIVGFDTTTDVAPLLGPLSYEVTSARLTLTTATDLAFIYDPTFDTYTGFLDEGDPEYVPDADAGQPIELYGTGYRSGFSLQTFAENTTYGFGDPLSKSIKTAYAIASDGAGGWIDVTNSVDDAFDPVPFALGVIAGQTPGTFVPSESTITFDLDVGDPGVLDYLRRGLDCGRVQLTVSSLTLVVQQGGDFPSYYTKEHPLVVDMIIPAPTLELTVEVSDAPCPADLDGNTTVGFADLNLLLGSWGPCDPNAACPGDLDCSGTVGFADLSAMLGLWGPCP